MDGHRRPRLYRFIIMSVYAFQMVKISSLRKAQINNNAERNILFGLRPEDIYGQLEERISLRLQPYHKPLAGFSTLRHRHLHGCGSQ